MPRYELKEFEVYYSPDEDGLPAHEYVKAYLVNQDGETTVRRLEATRKLVTYIENLSFSPYTDTTFIALKGNIHDGLIHVYVRSAAKAGLPHFERKE